jgi:NurA-like 5'-3' nuclease
MYFYGSTISYHGEKFKQYRISQMLGLQEAQRNSGLSLSTYVRLEKGGGLTMATLRKAIEGLGLTIEQARAKGLVVYH